MRYHCVLSASYHQILMSVLYQISVWVKTNIASILQDHSYADVIVVIEKEETIRIVKVAW